MQYFEIANFQVLKIHCLHLILHVLAKASKPLPHIFQRPYSIN